MINDARSRGQYSADQSCIIKEAGDLLETLIGYVYASAGLKTATRFVRGIIDFNNFK